MKLYKGKTYLVHPELYMCGITILGFIYYFFNITNYVLLQLILTFLISAIMEYSIGKKQWVYNPAAFNLFQVPITGLLVYTFLMVYLFNLGVKSSLHSLWYLQIIIIFFVLFFPMVIIDIVGDYFFSIYRAKSYYIGTLFSVDGLTWYRSKRYLYYEYNNKYYYKEGDNIREYITDEIVYNYSSHENHNKIQLPQEIIEMLNKPTGSSVGMCIGFCVLYVPFLYSFKLIYEYFF